MESAMKFSFRRLMRRKRAPATDPVHQDTITDQERTDMTKLSIIYYSATGHGVVGAAALPGGAGKVGRDGLDEAGVRV